MTPVTEFRQRNACRNCHQLDCRSEQCLNPDVFPGICKNCQQQGHKLSQYLSERTLTELFAIVQTTDIKNWITLKSSTITVKKSDARRSNVLNLFSKSQKKVKKSHFTLLDAVSETAETEALVPLPTILKSWDQLEVEDNTFDAGAVAKELARNLDIDDTEQDERLTNLRRRAIYLISFDYGVPR